jgi:hypothetical protein
MFAPYLLESRQTRTRVNIGRWSYVWAGLFGPLYVLAKGGRIHTLYALALTVVLTVILVGVVGATSFIPAFQQVWVVCASIPVVLTVQAVKTVEILKSAYRQRGWRVRTAD